MKIARTFTIDHSLYCELKKRKNQSATVEAALRNWIHDSEYIDLTPIPSERLLLELRKRMIINKELYLALCLQLPSSSSKEPSS